MARQLTAQIRLQVTGGQATPALLHIVQNMDLSDEDLAELRSLLERMQSEEDDK